MSGGLTRRSMWDFRADGASCRCFMLWSKPHEVFGIDADSFLKKVLMASQFDRGVRSRHTSERRILGAGIAKPGQLAPAEIIKEVAAQESKHAPAKAWRLRNFGDHPRCRTK